MIILLPDPPSLNKYYIVQKRGKFSAKVVSKEGLAYQNTLKKYKNLLNLPTFRGDMRVVVDCFPYSRNSRDIDNYFKCLFDSMQYAGIIENDNLIRREIGRMQSPFRPWPCILVEIQEICFKPMSIEEMILEFQEDGSKVFGLELAPKKLRDLFLHQNKQRQMIAEKK